MNPSADDIQVKISLDPSDLEQSVSKVRRQFITLEKTFQESQTSSSNFGESLIKLSDNTMRKMDAQIDRSRIRISKLKSQIEGQQKSMRSAFSSGDTDTGDKIALNIEQKQNQIIQERIALERRLLMQVKKRADAEERNNRLLQRQQSINEGLINLATMVGGSMAVQRGLNTSNELRRLQETTRVMLPTDDEFEQFMVQANQFSQEFNRPIFETIQAFREFLPIVRATSNQTGASMQSVMRQVLLISEQLGTLSPEQGVGGARIALQEFLAGDEESLIRRFELPVTREQLTELFRAGPEAALQGLSQYLGQIGITEDKLKELGETGIRGVEQLQSSFKLLGAVGMAPIEESINDISKDFSNFLNQLIMEEPELIKFIGTIGSLTLGITALTAAMSGAAALGQQRGVAGFFNLFTGNNLGAGMKTFAKMPSVRVGVTGASLAAGTIMGNEIMKFAAQMDIFGDLLSHVDDGLRASVDDLEKLSAGEIKQKFDLKIPTRDIANLINEARENDNLASAVLQLNRIIDKERKESGKKTPLEHTLESLTIILTGLVSVVIALIRDFHLLGHILSNIFLTAVLGVSRFLLEFAKQLVYLANTLGFFIGRQDEFNDAIETLNASIESLDEFNAGRGSFGEGPEGGADDIIDFYNRKIADLATGTADSLGLLGKAGSDTSEDIDEVVSAFDRLKESMDVTDEQVDKLIDAVKKYNEDTESAEDSHLKKLADINEDYAEKQIEIAKRAKEAAEKALQSLKDSRKDAQRDLKRDFAKQERELQDAVLEERQEYLRKEVEDYRKHVDKLKEILEKARQERDKALLEFDFRRIFEIMRDARNNIESEQEDFGIEQEEKVRQRQVELQDMQRDFEIKRRERMIAYREAQQDLKIRYNRELRDSRQAQQRALDDATEYHQKAIRLEHQAYQTRLQVLRDSIEKELELIMMGEEAKEAARLKLLQQARDIMGGSGGSSVSVQNNVNIDGSGLSPEELADAVGRGVQKGNDSVMRIFLSSVSDYNRIPSTWIETHRDLTR